MNSKSYDLCVIGAGFAGINALFVAAQYLGPGSKVLLIDKHKEIGGMWPRTYPFVRLHQPYQFFTFGSIGWSMKRERTHLATRDEILNHFHETTAKIQAEVQLEFALEHHYHDFEPKEDGVLVHFSPSHSPDTTHHILAQKLIVAVGGDIRARKALDFSSTQVRSISPNHLDQVIEADTSSPIPVYIMGSGKTAMDCVHWLHEDSTPKKISLIAGRGALFRNRDYVFPSSAFKRFFFGGKILHDAVMEDLIFPWEGDNTAEVLAKLRKTKKLISLVPEAENYQLGLISQSELDFIAKGLESRIIRGHLDDVIDDDEGQPTLLLRDGTRQRIERNAFIVNCTGHLADVATHTAPVLSPCGRVLTPAFYLGFSGTSSSLLTHALYLGRLHEISDRLYVNQINIEPKSEVPFRSGLASLANALMVGDLLPMKVLVSTQSNAARWYPLHRRILSGLRGLSRKNAILEKAERLLR